MLMFWGVGTDILHISRIGKLGTNFDDPFFRKNFTAAERALASEQDALVSFYAGEFAAKEAVFKSLRINAEGLKWSDIEILMDQNCRPTVSLYGVINEKAKRNSISHIDVSISCDTEYAIAFAVSCAGEKSCPGETAS
jgi:holo-[acyl-carrier protein] synthase